MRLATYPDAASLEAAVIRWAGATWNVGHPRSKGRKIVWEGEERGGVRHFTLENGTWLFCACWTDSGVEIFREGVGHQRAEVA